MMNIFMMFDPATSKLMALNWILIPCTMFMYPNKFWTIKSRWNKMMELIMEKMNKELKIKLKKKIYKINMFTMFMHIMTMNLMSMMPYLFSSTSHMVLNLSMSMPMWMSLMMMGWMFNFKKMMYEQIPMMTPKMLMPFMVMIELSSNMIRPLTLSIRLTANMIAGHLLILLISKNGKINLMMLMVMILQTPLMILELSVSIIQAYVFTMLISMYSSET